MDSGTRHILAAVGLGLLGLSVGRLLTVVTARLCARFSAEPPSLRFPRVELLTCALFLACLWRFGWRYELVLGLVLVSLLVPLTLIDAAAWVIPMQLTLPGMAAGVLLSIPLGWARVAGALWGVVVGFGSFRALEYLGFRLFGRETLGGGDKYLLALLGAFLTAWPLLTVVVLGSLQAMLFGIVQQVRGRREEAAELPEEEEEAWLEDDLPLGLPEEEEVVPPPRISWRFLAPGLSPWRRVVLVPFSLLVQPIPDRPPPVEVLEATPGVRSLPFGPWLALAGLEVTLLGPVMGALA